MELMGTNVVQMGKTFELAVSYHMCKAFKYNAYFPHKSGVNVAD